MTSQVQFESFDIVIDSAPPYGFRLVQKLMDNSLVVSKLRQGGKAGEAGLKEGDVLLAVNSRSCGGFNCSQALNLIDSASQPLVLTVKRKAGTHPKPVNQPVIVRQTNFLPKKKPNQPSPVPFKPSIESSPEPPKTSPLVPSTPTQEKPVEPTKIFVGSTIQEPKEDEKNQKVEFGLKSSVVVEQPSFTDSQKKTYTDSAFFNDPGHKYPTLEEQVQLARKVAMSVLAPANANSKGHKMFMRAKERAWKYTTGGAEDNDEAPAEATEGLQIMPKKVAFVPKLPEESTGERVNAMSNEELELMRLQGRKTTHTNVAPQVCFSLADDLKNMKGKGGKLFAKRQAKADSWTVGGGSEEMGEGDLVTEEENQVTKEREQRKVMDKLSSKHQMEKLMSGENDADATPRMGYGGTPINKLDSMVAANKAAMTPWQTAAEYGNVNKAFEHLGKMDFQHNNDPRPQQESQRPQNVRPNSWTPNQPKGSEDFAKVRVLQARSPGYRPVKFPATSIEPPVGIPISDA